LITITAIDQLPNGVPHHTNDRILNLNPSQTKGLSYQLLQKIGARVMLTSNVDLSDNLINGLIGTVSHMEQRNNRIEIIYVKLDNLEAGKKKEVENIVTRQMRYMLILEKSELYTSCEMYIPTN